MAKNPAAILYDENGVRTGVEDNALRISADPAKVAVHSNVTITSDDSIVLTGYGQTELLLFLNIKASPTGTDPTLQYTIEEVDPGDETTVIGTAVTSEVFEAIGNQTISFVTLNGGAVKVSWAVTGTDTPSFTQVYATVLAKSGGTAKMLGIGTGAFFPDPAGTWQAPVAGEKSVASIDKVGSLMTRGPVLTDEGSFFDDFVDPTLDSSWVVQTSGGSSFVYLSILVLAAGTASGNYVWVLREGDYGPMTVTTIMKIDGRQASQHTNFGFSNDYPPGSPHIKRALCVFKDKNSRIFQFQTQASASQIEVTDCEIPDDGRSTEFHRYTIEVGSGYVALMVDGIAVATHKRHIPGPYDTMGYGVTVDNDDVVSATTTVYVDSLSFRNHNAVEIAGHFTGDPLRVRVEDDLSVGIRGDHADIVAEHEGLYSRGGRVEGGRELLAVADPELRSTANDILNEFRRLNTVIAEMSGLNITKADFDE